VVNTCKGHPNFQNSSAPKLTLRSATDNNFAHPNFGRLFVALTLALCLTNFW